MGTHDLNRFSPSPAGAAHGSPASAFGDESEAQGTAALAGGLTDSATAWESAWIDLGGEG